MKAIEVSPNEHQYPNHVVSHVDCRKRDLIIRISDWTQDRDEPAYDADGVYVGKLADNQECPQGCTVKLEPLLC